MKNIFLFAFLLSVSANGICALSQTSVNGDVSMTAKKIKDKSDNRQYVLGIGNTNSNKIGQ